jgi:hypothetical protein
MKINFTEEKIIFSLSKKLFMESFKNNNIIILHREDFLKLWKNEPNPISKELNEGNLEIWKKDSKYKEAERGFSYGDIDPVPLAKIVINEENDILYAALNDGITRTIFLLSNNITYIPFQIIEMNVSTEELKTYLDNEIFFLNY